MNLRPLYVSLGLSAILWSCAANAVTPDETNFVCVSEEAANAIARASVEDVLNGSPDAVAQPYIDAGSCFFTPTPVEIRVVRHGKTFAKFSKVEVVCFCLDSPKTHEPSGMLYAIKRLAIYEGAI